MLRVRELSISLESKYELGLTKKVHDPGKLVSPSCYVVTTYKVHSKVKILHARCKHSSV